MQVDPYFFPPYTKLKAKWIKDLNIKPDILNLTEEKMKSSIEFIGTGDGYFQALRSTIIKWGLIKLKSFCLAKNTFNWTKVKPIEWENMFADSTFNKRLNSISPCSRAGHISRKNR